MNSRKALKKWDLGFIQKRRKFSATRGSSTRTQTKKNSKTKIQTLTRNESVKNSGQIILFHRQETTEIKNRIRTAYRQELTSKKLHAQSSFTVVRRRNISDNMSRSKNIDSQQRTRKNDSIDATQDVDDSSFKQKRDAKRSRNKKSGSTKMLKKLTSMKHVWH